VISKKSEIDERKLIQPEGKNLSSKEQDKNYAIEEFSGPKI
jgi:hypothetical protein